MELLFTGKNYGETKGRCRNCCNSCLALLDAAAANTKTGGE